MGGRNSSHTRSLSTVESMLMGHARPTYLTFLLHEFCLQISLGFQLLKLVLVVCDLLIETLVCI